VTATRMPARRSGSAELEEDPPHAVLRVVHPPARVDLVAAELAAAAFLNALGIDTEGEGMAKTPARMTRAYTRAVQPAPLRPDHLSERCRIRRAHHRPVDPGALGV